MLGSTGVGEPDLISLQHQASLIVVEYGNRKGGMVPQEVGED